jgi:hypothetical protein
VAAGVPYLGIPATGRLCVSDDGNRLVSQRGGTPDANAHSVVLNFDGHELTLIVAAPRPQRRGT